MGAGCLQLAPLAPLTSRLPPAVYKRDARRSHVAARMQARAEARVARTIAGFVPCLALSLTRAWPWFFYDCFCSHLCTISSDGSRGLARTIRKRRRVKRLSVYSTHSILSRREAYICYGQLSSFQRARTHTHHMHVHPNSHTYLVRAEF